MFAVRLPLLVLAALLAGQTTRTMSGTVTRIDEEKNRVYVKQADGRTVSFYVDPDQAKVSVDGAEQKKLADLSPGHKVRIQYGTRLQNARTITAEIAKPEPKKAPDAEPAREGPVDVPASELKPLSSFAVQRYGDELNAQKERNAQTAKSSGSAYVVLGPAKMQKGIAGRFPPRTPALQLTVIQVVSETEVLVNMNWPEASVQGNRVVTRTGSAHVLFSGIKTNGFVRGNVFEPRLFYEVLEKRKVEGVTATVVEPRQPPSEKGR